MQEKRRINFDELRLMIETGHQWRFRRFLKSVFGVFGAHGSGSFAASGITAIAMAGGVATGVAVATILPAVIIPVGLLYIGIVIYDQYNKRKIQKESWNKIFDTPNTLGKYQVELRYFIEEGIWINGLYEMLDNFEGLTIEKKLQNIFGNKYDDVKNKEAFIDQYNSVIEKAQERESTLSHFFDQNDRKLNLDDESEKQLVLVLQNQVRKLNSDQYENLSPKINSFNQNNPNSLLEAGVSLKETTYNSERAVKNWKYYLEHGGKTVLTAILGAAAGFGFVAGIGTIAGVAVVSSTGVGLGVLIGAVVVAVVIAVVAVAVKTYVDDKEQDIIDALNDAGKACDTFSFELLSAKGNIASKKTDYKFCQENQDQEVLNRAIRKDLLPKENNEVMNINDDFSLKTRSFRFSIKNFFTRRSSQKLEENEALRQDKKA